MTSTNESAWAVRIPGALLCVAVSVIHVIDQGGFPGAKTPGYVGAGYYVLEIASVVAAILLLSGGVRPGWALATGVAAGPIIGYVLSRGPGLPGYGDDRGNWTEPLGVLSLLVEGILLILSATYLLAGLRRGAPAQVRQTPAGSEAGR